MCFVQRNTVIHCITSFYRNLKIHALYGDGNHRRGFHAILANLKSQDIVFFERQTQSIFNTINNTKKTYRKMKQLSSLITILLLTASVSFAQEKKLGENEPFVPTAEELAKYLPELKGGDAAPSLAAPDTLGNTVSLADYRGSYVIVDFWATWCGDCRREIPGLKALYEEYADTKINGAALQWLSFSFDFNATAWKNMLRKENFPWPQISNLKRTREDPTFANWKLRWIPAFFIIAPDGVIAATAITADGLRSEIVKLQSKR